MYIKKNIKDIYIYIYKRNIAQPFKVPLTKKLFNQI